MVSYYPVNSVEEGDCRIMPSLSLFVFITNYWGHYRRLLLEYGFIPAYRFKGIHGTFNEKTAIIANCYTDILFNAKKLRKINLNSRLNLFLHYYYNSH